MFYLQQIEQEVFVLIPFCFTSSALSDFSWLPIVEISVGYHLFLLVIDHPIRPDPVFVGNRSQHNYGL
jgi:hypothetical protein